MKTNGIFDLAFLFKKHTEPGPAYIWASFSNKITKSSLIFQKFVKFLKISKIFRKLIENSLKNLNIFRKLGSLWKTLGNFLEKDSLRLVTHCSKFFKQNRKQIPRNSQNFQKFGNFLNDSLIFLDS